MVPRVLPTACNLPSTSSESISRILSQAESGDNSICSRRSSSAPCFIAPLLFFVAIDTSLVKFRHNCDGHPPLLPQRSNFIAQTNDQCGESQRARAPADPHAPRFSTLTPQ